MTKAAKIDTHHILSSVLEAAVVTAPFEHCIVDSLFSETDYAAIHGNWPDPTAFEPLSTFEPDKYPERRQFQLTDEKLRSLTSEQKRFWEELRRSLCSPEFARMVFAKFEAILAPRMQAGNGGSIELDLRLLEDQSSYALGPHTDVNYKLLTLLIYLPEDRSLAEFGTSLYRPRDPKQHFDHSGHHAREDFELVATAPFLPNSAFVFPRTDRSFHGVEPFTAPEKSRKLLVYNIYLKS